MDRLVRAAIGAALVALPSSRAFAEVRYTYVSNDFTNAPYGYTNFEGYFDLNMPLTQYLEPEGAINAREIFVELTNSDFKFTVYSGNVPELTLSGPPSTTSDFTFTLIATLNTTETAIDWSQGWRMAITGSSGWTDASRTQYGLLSGYSGPSQSFYYNGIQNVDEFVERPLYGGGYGAGFYNQNDQGTWTAGAIPSPIPEPSTWAMMLIGFMGLGYAGYRRAKRNSPAFAD